MTSHLRVAWNAYRASWVTFTAWMLVVVAAWAMVELAVVATYRLGIIPWLVLHATFVVFFSGLLVGIHRMALDAIDGATPSLRALPDALRHGPTLLLGAGIHTLAVVVGLLLFVVPGIYLGARYSLFPEVIAARGGSAWNALREAGTLTRGSWWLVFRFQLLLIALNVCAIALLGIGLMITFPVSVLAAASLFRALERNRAQTV